MGDLKVLSEDSVVRLISQAGSREYAVFLGAGASRSSGVPLGSEMVEEWKALAWRESRAQQPFADWCTAQPWATATKQYSILFEMLYPDARARQRYVEPMIEKAFPNWGYVYLANLIRADHFNLVFTTNFDDLVNEALTRFLRYNAVVCAAEADVATINTNTARAKIIKLHGDYLFKRLKNTEEELQRLDPVMEKKFGEFAHQCGLLVLGYHGADRSIMGVMEALLADPDAFPTDIYWGRRPDAGAMPDDLDRLARAYPRRLHLFEVSDFDVFMARIHAGKNLQTPLTIVDPLEGLRANFERLQQINDTQRADPTIAADVALILHQQAGAISQAQDLSVIDLFEAKIALGLRDYKKALPRIEDYCATKPKSADALTTWGMALQIQAEEEGRQDLLEDTVAKWREAVQLDPNWIPARYGLARHFAMSQKVREATLECEQLMKLTPKDQGLRMNLVSLYTAAGRTQDALELLNSLLEKDKDNPEMRLAHAGLLEQRGLVAEATAEVLEIVQTAPANPRVHFACAVMLARTGQQAQAASEFNMAVQNDPGNTSYRIQAGMFFLSINDPYQALTHLEAAVRKEPQSAEAHAWYAQTLLLLQRLPEAQHEIEQALGLNGRDTRILCTAGTIHMQMKRLDLAEHEFQTAIDQNPQNFGAHAQLASIYWMQRRAQDYQSSMQRLMQLNPQMAQQVQQYLQMQGTAQMAPGFAQPPQARSPWPQPSPSGEQTHWLSELSKLLR